MFDARRRNPLPVSLAHRLALVAALIVAWNANSPSFAAEPQQATTADPMPAFFAKHCRECHSGDKPKGKFALGSLSPDFADKENHRRIFWKATWRRPSAR